ncbi:MAG: hypothetical protein ACP6IS_01365 [Candidatus Asgardarchaeia archaeon]
MIPRKEEYLLLDVLHRILTYYRQKNIDFKIDDLINFTRKYLTGFEWEHEFARLISSMGFISLKIDPIVPQPLLVNEIEVFDFLLFMGDKGYAVECKVREDPLIIGTERVERQLQFAKLLHLDDLLIAWKSDIFWFLFSVKALKEKTEKNKGISFNEIFDIILREVAKEQVLLDVNINPNGLIKMGGMYAGLASKALTFRELLSLYGSKPAEKRCSVCGKPTYYTCRSCGKPICLNHAVQCEIENEIYCTDCATPRRCKICGRMGCSQCVDENGICYECHYLEEVKDIERKLAEKSKFIFSRMKSQ